MEGVPAKKRRRIVIEEEQFDLVDYEQWKNELAHAVAHAKAQKKNLLTVSNQEAINLARKYGLVMSHPSTSSPNHAL